MKEEEIKEAGEKVFLHIDDFRSYQVRFEDAQRKRAGFEVDIRLISSKGEMKPCTLKVTPIRGEQGRITGWINVCTERSLLSGKGVNTTDPIFQFFGDAVPNFLLILSADYFIEFSNARWQNYTGLHRTDDRYNNWRGQIHSDDLPKLNRLLNGFKIQPRTAELELRLRNKFGEYHWHSLRVVPITSENGTLEKSIVTITNVEQKRKALEELRRKDQKFNLALETGRIGIWEYNTIHNSITLSGKSNEFLDLHKEVIEITVSKFFRKIYKADRVFLIKSVKNALKQGKEFRLDVRVSSSKSVEYIYLSIYGTPTVNSTGEISGLFGTIMDVTETKKIENSFDDMLAIEKVARKEAERRGALKDQFLASVSSELKTPFNAILGWSQALQKDITFQNNNDLNKLQANPERVGDYLQRLKEVEKNALMQSQLVESLLELSRIVSGSVELTLSKVDLLKTFSEVVDSMKASLAFKGIKYYQKIIPEEIGQNGMFVEGDGFRLQQALWNCLNAILTVMSKEESITTLIKSSNKWIEIGYELKVNHSTYERLSMIFKNAENWDSLANREEKIAAVNFLLAQNLISFHLGSFFVLKDEKPKSMGSSFRLLIKLPVNKEVVNALNAKNAVDSVVDLNGKRVLLLHSDPLLRREISKVLENSKAEVVTTDTIHDAVEVYKAKKADIILTDLSFEDKIPGKEGQPETQYTFIKKIKDLQSLNKDFVPTIALSGLESKTDKVEAVSQGYQACVSSPLEEDRLVGLIADLVKAH